MKDLSDLIWAASFVHHLHTQSVVVSETTRTGLIVVRDTEDQTELAAELADADVTRYMTRFKENMLKEGLCQSCGHKVGQNEILIDGYLVPIGTETRRRNEQKAYKERLADKHRARERLELRELAMHCFDGSEFIIELFFSGAGAGAAPEQK
jgi:hypothetical protein